MNDRPNIESLLRLPAGERLALVEALWDSLTADPTSVPVPDRHLDILKHRIAADDLAPDDGSTWAEVRAVRLDQVRRHHPRQGGPRTGQTERR